MATAPTRKTALARYAPPLALLAVAAACVLFALSTSPADDPTGFAAGQATSLALPAWFTAAFAGLAAAVFLLLGSDPIGHRAAGLLGLIASIGAALGGVLNFVGYANSNIWWAANPDGIRQAALALLVTALVALAIVGSEQLWPGWRRAAR